jgi:hypothetical protein
MAFADHINKSELPMEPMTLFSRIADPAKVARFLREQVPTVEIDGPDHDWRNAVVSFGNRKLAFTHDPSYYAEPNWSVQMNGMQGYFSRFPVSERRELALLLPTTFKFSLGLLLDPDCDALDDPRLELIFGVTELLDGVIFTPSAFRDARGRILYGAGGEEEEDPDAKWPRVVAEVSVADSRGGAAHEASRPKSPAEDDLSQAPSVQRVARRALALTAVGARAILEQDGGVILKPGTSRWHPHYWFSRRESQRLELVEWVRLVGIDDELEPDEWEVVERPVGGLEQGQQINSTWRLEGLAVLAWALSRQEMPAHDELVQVYSLLAKLGVLDVVAAKELLVHATLRPRGELAKLRNGLFALHWRLTDFRVNRKTIDFPEFAKTAWFGPLDVSNLKMIERDLAIQGKRLDRASADALSTASSAAHERHQAANWLWQGPERYSEASVDT